jgi:hypothetical protein
MSLADIGTVADDIHQRAKSLQVDFEALLSRAQQGSQLWQDLYAMKCKVSAVKMESIKLHSLTGAARMTGELPKERALAPVEHLPLFKTKTPEELTGHPGTDHKMLAAGDHSFDEDTNP